MSRYRITLTDRSTEHIDHVDAYQQEGPMTTFFRTGSDRHVVDTWSTRVASFRTSEVLAIRRIETADASLAAVEALSPAASPAGVGTASPASVGAAGLRSA